MRMWQGTLPRLFCCRAGDEPGRLDQEESREGRKSEGSLPDFLANVDCGLTWRCLLKLGAVLL